MTDAGRVKEVVDRIRADMADMGTASVLVHHAVNGHFGEFLVSNGGHSVAVVAAAGNGEGDPGSGRGRGGHTPRVARLVGIEGLLQREQLRGDPRA
jgi:hypothetical protein